METLRHLEIESEIARYIKVLEASGQATKRAEDRQAYQQHLAAAAVLLADLVSGGSLARARVAIASEARSFGTSFLDGDSGREAEAAFQRVRSMLEHL
jgi:hypothetical protein